MLLPPPLLLLLLLLLLLSSPSDSDLNVSAAVMRHLSEPKFLLQHSKHGSFLDYHFLSGLENRKRLSTRNPCFEHLKTDGVHGSPRAFCLPKFWILGPQKCGTTDTFEHTMRHSEVVRLNPKVREQLESHLLTVEIEEMLQKPHGPRTNTNNVKMVFRHSSRNYGKHHLSELVDHARNGRIVGDASADHMYRRAIPQIPTPLLLHALLPEAKLIAVLRDPVERTYSDFRFFFSCSISRSAFLDCPRWWPVPAARDHRNPAARFHEVVLREVREFAACLASDDGAARRSRGFGRATVLDAISNPRSGGVHHATRGRVSRPLLHEQAAAEAQALDFLRESTLNSSSSSSSSASKSRSSAERLLVDDPVRLSECTQRPDLNRDMPLNKCYRSVRCLNHHHHHHHHHHEYFSL